MADILPFRIREPATRPAVADARGEIVIFPGVRYEVIANGFANARTDKPDGGSRRKPMQLPLTN